MNPWILFANENALRLWPDGGLTPPAALVAAPGRNQREFTAVQQDMLPGVPCLNWPLDSGKVPGFLEELACFSPVLFVSSGFNRIFPPGLFSFPPRGTVNIHGGWLPTMRGAHVVNWALIEDRRSTGVTLHRMDAGIDTGPWIARKRLRIRETDDARTLRDRLYLQGWTLLADHLTALCLGTARETPQRDHGARHYPRRRPEDGQVHCSMPARAIHQRVRALVRPWPGAYLRVNGEPLRIWKTRVIEDHSRIKAGTCRLTDDDQVWLRCGENALLLLDSEWQGSPLTPERLTAILREGYLE